MSTTVAAPAQRYLTVHISIAVTVAAVVAFGMEISSYILALNHYDFYTPFFCPRLWIDSLQRKKINYLREHERNTIFIYVLLCA